MKRIASLACLTALLLALPETGHAQVDRKVFASPYRIDPSRKGCLMLDIDNLSFFQNDELKGGVASGYTLPGLWVQPRLVYYPLSNLKIELGAHLLYYSGAHEYPVAGYQGIAEWNSGNRQSGIHALPFFRAQLSGFDGALNLVLGNLYGGSTHRLAEPLYDPELNLSADPETGLQLLYNSRRIDADAWINWQSFIFRNDQRKEQFTLALSSRFKLSREDSPIQAYIPLQLVAQHRGGEIQHEDYHGISSVANAAIGIGAEWDTKRPVLKQIFGEAEFLGYKQLAGNLWPIQSGSGWHASAGVQLKDFQVKLGYMKSDNFISLLGSPYFGSLSVSRENTLFRHSQLVYGKAEYTHGFGKICSVGVRVTVFQHFPGEVQAADGGLSRPGSSTSVLAGVFLRITPSLFLHRF